MYLLMYNVTIHTQCIIFNRVFSWIRNGVCLIVFCLHHDILVFVVGRKRKDYVSQLTKDLCLYYDYNEYLMTKVMQIFPLDDVSFFLWISCHILQLALLSVSCAVALRSGRC